MPHTLVSKKDVATGLTLNLNPNPNLILILNLKLLHLLSPSSIRNVLLPMYHCKSHLCCIRLPPRPLLSKEISLGVRTPSMRLTLALLCPLLGTTLLLIRLYRIHLHLLLQLAHLLSVVQMVSLEFTIPMRLGLEFIHLMSPSIPGLRAFISVGTTFHLVPEPTWTMTTILLSHSN